VQASSIHYNKVPKVLKGEWSTKYLKVNDSSNPKVHYRYTRLFVTNRDFHLEGYYADKHKNNISNSGIYGSFAGSHHKLAFRKICSRHYVITGDYQPTSTDNKSSGYRVRLSKSHKSMKLYCYAKVKRPGYVKGKRQYVGNFYR